MAENLSGRLVDLKAAGIMSSPVAAIRADASIREAARAMAEHKVSGLPVLDAKGKGVGLISASDLVACLVAPQDGDRKVRDVMTPGIVTAPFDATLGQVARLMAEKRIHRVFIRSQGRIRGVVTSLDVTRAVWRASRRED